MLTAYVGMETQKINNLPEKTLIIFTRFPEPGKAKTRLIPALGSEGAAELQHKMTKNIVSVALKCKENQNISLQIYYQGGSQSAMKNWLGDLTYILQAEGGLGAKLIKAAKNAFNTGSSKVVLIGADCPGLSDTILTQAFSCLDKADLVLGPATDGGYYLIGMTHPYLFLFDNISWGSNAVLKQTLSLAQQQKLTVALLEKLHDIDRPEDIKHFRYYSSL